MAGPKEVRLDVWVLLSAALVMMGAGLGWRDPWPADEPRFAPRADVVAADPHELLRIDAAEFRRRYADTAFERPSRDGIARNARHVIENRRESGAGDIKRPLEQ